MLQEEEGENHIGSSQVAFGEWPPTDRHSNRPMGFMTKVSRGPGGRPVEWPPRRDPELSSSQEQLDQQEENPNLTTTYPSGFKLKDQPTFQTGTAKVVTSQPAFKITQPIRRRGDDKWPPKGSAEVTQDEVREFVKPRKANKNYDEFFAQNALPHNYAGYRAPPGTQHKGVGEENGGVSDM